jgi:hypothetical protein
MKLPAPDEYRDAMQNPRLAFADPDLKFAECEKDHWGLPRIMTGGFAAIFHLRRGRSQWAVRCFYKDVAELRRRYDAIGQFLTKCQDGVFVDASLLHDGILVQGQRYPIIKMEWIDGDPLNLYIERNISKRQAISWLPDAFLELAGRLQKLGIAHGDLQHGNIMVTDHSLKLIDYDGVFLPELKGLPNNQQGHPNYQLPSRADEYGPEIDRFSEVVIYTALKAVVESPSLWKKYSNGENLLFQQDDFVDPDSSELMSDLEQISDIGSLVPKVRALCALGIEDVPALEDFLSGRWQPPTVVPPPIKVPPRPLRPIFEVLEASDTAGLLARVGHRVTVVGQIISIHRDLTRYGQPYAFLNFGDWRRDFYLVAWSGALGLFTAEGLEISSYKGKWISITGILSSYRNRPQIEVEMPSQVEVLSGKEEARNRIKGLRVAPQPVKPAAPKAKPTPIIQQQVVKKRKLSTTTDVMTRQDAQTLSRLYSTYQPSPPSHAPPSRPTTPPRAGETIPSPALFAGGVLLILTAIAVAALRIYLLSLFLAIIGLPVAYYALTHYSTLMPVQVMSYTSTNARFVGRCRGCGRLIQKRSAIVKTDRGWMHLQCTSSAKKRVWIRA